MDTASDTLNALKVGADDGRKTAKGMKKGKTMAKLIDRDKAIQQINEKARKWSGSFYGTGLVGAVEILLNVPTVAAVPVVLCKECKWYDEEGEFCRFWHGCRHPEHFCGEGERKDNG